jgi:CRP-like cAMP-binding protein
MSRSSDKRPLHEVLKSARLFAELDEAALREIAATASRHMAAADEVLFNDGEPARCFYIVASGKVKVFKLSPEGKEQILLIAQPGDTFAEAAMFAGGEYPASAQTLEASELAAVDRGRFVGLLERNPELALNLIARLSGLLRRLTHLIEELSLSDVTTRLAHYLCTHLDETGGSHIAGIHLEEKKAVLASQLGTIPETLSRSFARLSREGIIRVDGPNITVLDPQRLEDLADSGGITGRRPGA